MAFPEPSTAPRKAPPGKYQLEILSNQEFTDTFSNPDLSSLYHPVSLSLTITFKGVLIRTSLVAQHKVGTSVVYIANDQAKNFSDQSIEHAVCLSCPNLWDKIISTGRHGISLPFTEQSQESVLYPLTREVAANIILAFFNAGIDPVDRINMTVNLAKEGSRAIAGRMLTTYYLCCIKYLTDIDTVTALQGEPKCEPLLDDLQIVTSKHRQTYLGLKEQKRDIPKEMIAFHAVYGAYVMCRPVATKRSFREWISKRYSSFLASIQYTPETNVNLPLQAGGTQVNETVIERSSIRKVIYQLTKIQTEDVVVSAIKNHIKFLTSLSEMTTYSLINQVIARGGAVICIAPLANQVSQYAKERQEVAGMMVAENIPDTDIVYIHLIKPTYQCFRSSDYPDLVRTAQLIDEISNPNDKTLANYKAKTSGATCNESHIKQFLRAQQTRSGLKIDEGARTQISQLMGESTEAIYEEAKLILDILRKKNQSSERGIDPTT